MIELKTPLEEKDILKLKAGDSVILNGTVFTARDKAHRYLVNHHFNRITGSVIYHCGPIMRGKEVISAGPTTSGRLSRYVPELIRSYGIKAFIGKGGMDSGASEALGGKAVYLAATGGSGVLYADRMKTRNVFFPEFGMPEAVWEFGVRAFPLIVAIDAKGNSLYGSVLRDSEKVFASLIGKN